MIKHSILLRLLHSHHGRPRVYLLALLIVKHQLRHHGRGRNEHDWGDLHVGVEYGLQVVADELIIRLVLVSQRLDMIEYVPHLDHVPGGDPEFLLGLGHAISLDGLDLIHRVILLLSPLEFLIEEIEDHEVQGPEVVPPAEVL